jgi:hypothetical protein
VPPRLHPAQSPASICLLFVVSSASSPQSSRQQQMYPALLHSVSLSLKDPGRAQDAGTRISRRLQATAQGSKKCPLQACTSGLLLHGSGHWPRDGTGSPNRRGTFWPSHVVGTPRWRKPWRAIPPGNWAAAPSPFRSTPSAPPQTAAANGRAPLTVSVAGGCSHTAQASEASALLIHRFQASGASDCGVARGHVAREVEESRVIKRCVADGGCWSLFGQF